ncbi:MAG: hypothetical protein ACXW2V_10045, partial [Candidatus Aminicenantales bacterium]
MTHRFRPSPVPRPLGVFVLILTVMASCKPASQSPYFRAALEAAAWVKSAEIRSPEGLSWPAIPRDLDSVGLDLYSGVPGVVLFFVQTFYATGDQAFLDDARAGGDFLLSKAASVGALGLYEGLSGVAFALEETYKASKDEKYRRGFLECLRRIQSAAATSGAGIAWS